MKDESANDETISNVDWVERLRRDVLAGKSDSSEVSESSDDFELASASSEVSLEQINYATLEFEIELSRKRLAIWDIFLTHMREGAQTWEQIRHALTADDLDRITTICDGTPLRHVLVDA